MTAAHSYLNSHGQRVSAVPGEKGRVITGRPNLVVLHNPNLDDPFAAFDDTDEECLTCPPGTTCCCTADSSDADWDRDY